MEELKSIGKDCYINVDDITVCYDDFGEGETPIIFIHGFPFDKLSWQPQLQELKSKFRVIAYDLRGFGNSTIGNSNGSIDLFADDLVHFMNKLEIKRAIVCGLSMGGYILLNAIVRYPQRFEAIILCDTQCIADSKEGKENRKKSISEILAGNLNAFTDGFISKVFSEKSLQTKGDIVEKVRSTIFSTKTESIAKTLRILAEREESCSTLPRIICPTLILCGREDAITPIAQAEILHGAISYSQLEIIEDAGHLSNLEQPDKFNKHIFDFISSFIK